MLTLLQRAATRRAAGEKSVRAWTCGDGECGYRPDRELGLCAYCGEPFVSVWGYWVEDDDGEMWFYHLADVRDALVAMPGPGDIVEYVGPLLYSRSRATVVACGPIARDSTLEGRIDRGALLRSVRENECVIQIDGADAYYIAEVDDLRRPDMEASA